MSFGKKATRKFNTGLLWTGLSISAFIALILPSCKDQNEPLSPIRDTLYVNDTTSIIQTDTTIILDRDTLNITDTTFNWQDNPCSDEAQLFQQILDIYNSYINDIIYLYNDSENSAPEFNMAVNANLAAASQSGQTLTLADSARIIARVAKNYLTTAPDLTESVIQNLNDIITIWNYLTGDWVATRDARLANLVECINANSNSPQQAQQRLRGLQKKFKLSDALMQQVRTK